MTYTSKAAVCSEILISLSIQSEHNVEFSNVYTIKNRKSRAMYLFQIVNLEFQRMLSVRILLP